MDSSYIGVFRNIFSLPLHQRNQKSRCKVAMLIPWLSIDKMKRRDSKSVWKGIHAQRSKQLMAKVNHCRVFNHINIHLYY